MSITVDSPVRWKNRLRNRHGLRVGRGSDCAEPNVPGSSHWFFAMAGWYGRAVKTGVLAETAANTTTSLSFTGIVFVFCRFWDHCDGTRLVRRFVKRENHHAPETDARQHSISICVCSHIAFIFRDDIGG